jgi:hypothetical protein
VPFVTKLLIVVRKFLFDGRRTFSLKLYGTSVARPLAPQPIAVLDVQPQRFLHLFQQLHRELCVVPVAPTFLDRSTLMLDEPLPFGNMALCFYEVLRKSSSVAVHHVSSAFGELQQDMCQSGQAVEPAQVART